MVVIHLYRKLLSIVTKQRNNSIKMRLKDDEKIKDRSVTEVSVSTTESSTSTVYRMRSDYRISKNRLEKRSPTPVNVIIWAVEILGQRTQGVPVEKIRSLIKQHFILPCKSQDIDKRIDMAIWFAINFGILEQSENLFYLKPTKTQQTQSELRLQ